MKITYSNLRHWGFHGSDYVDSCRLECVTILFGAFLPDYMTPHPRHQYIHIKFQDLLQNPFQNFKINNHNMEYRL